MKQINCTLCEQVTPGEHIRLEYWKARKVVAEQRRAEVWLHCKRISLLVLQRTDPNGQEAGAGLGKRVEWDKQ